MRISVIIPAHNARSTLGEAIESVRAQTLPAAEIVVVDDGSTDDTAAVAAGFQDVRLVRRPNGGPGAAYNSGIEVSQGDLVAFLDADDIMAPMALAEHVQNLTAHPAADASVGHVSEFVSPDLPSEVAARLRPRPTYVGWLAGATMVRLSLLERTGSFLATLHVGAWIDWVDRARLAGGRFELTPRILLRRRLRPGTLSASSRRDADLIALGRLALQRRREQDR